MVFRFILLLLLSMCLHAEDRQVIESINEKYLNYRITSNNYTVKYSSRVLLYEFKDVNGLKSIFILKKDFKLSKDFDTVDTTTKYYVGMHYKF